jgi:hypothetical protein
MISKLKFDLENELKSLASNNDTNTNGSVALDCVSTINRLKQKQQHDLNLKSKIKHLDEQLKGVLFLMMQCQIGLENLNDASSPHLNFDIHENPQADEDEMKNDSEGEKTSVHENYFSSENITKNEINSNIPDIQITNCEK